MPEAVLTQTICCSFAERLVMLLTGHEKGPNVTEMSAWEEEKKLPVIVTSLPPAVVPRSGTTEDTWGVRSERAVKISELTAKLVCTRSLQPRREMSMMP